MINQLISSLDDTQILQLTLIGEARGEPIEGQIAVGCVIRNRLHHNPTRYKSYLEVCIEKEQFSCWNLNDPNYSTLLELAESMHDDIPLRNTHIRQCAWIAVGIISWSIIDNTDGALYYMTKELFSDSDERPIWAVKAINSITYGKQIFFSI
jgi:N-acetylmuramoyl-L-alanine amidase